MAGPTHVLNGGIIAALIDCHSVCTAIAAAYREEGRAIGTDPSYWYVTASLDITYLRPTAIADDVVLHADITRIEGKKTTVSCALSSREKVRAQAEVLAVRVPPAWLEAPIR
jgi:acyl-coenzyme A thioesterase PaaI-like protein